MMAGEKSLKKASLPTLSPELNSPASKHDIFQAIADPTRRSILKLLVDKEMAIASIVELFPMGRTAVNKHLHVLSEAKLVTSRKVGRETRYKLQPEPLVELQEWLDFFEHYWANKLDSLKEFVENNEEK